ncbi:MAG: hypothetical protein HQL21_06995 [Candidatus Omnitrophica bacterium]|nr:hypothetical protein [Candidatus Omnitrophota bacterium]
MRFSPQSLFVDDMMAKKESAEEKLLKIIEVTKKAQGPASGAGPSSGAAKRSGRFVLSTRKINFLLIVGAIASLLFLGYEFNGGVSLLAQDVNISVDGQGSRGAPNIFAQQVRNFSYYLEQINSRNIFKPYEKITTGTEVTSAKAALEKRMSKYKMVGVAWLDTPESATVMIEDTSNRMTHFLREGEKIEDVTVKTIYTDRVVLSYANEEMVIKL